FRVGALNQASVEADAPAGSATTLNPYVAPPIVTAPSMAQTQAQFFWTQGANHSSLNYTANCSTTPAFTGSADQTKQGIDVFSATFSGLLTNTSYYFRVHVNSISPISSTGPYATLAGIPVSTVPAFSGVGDLSLTAAWNYGLNPAGTEFLVEASSTGF